MSPNLKKFLITSGLTAFVFLIVAIVARGNAKPSPADAAKPDETKAVAPQTDAPQTVAPKDEGTASAAPQPVAAPGQKLAARIPEGMSASGAPASIGALDPAVAPWRIDFAHSGAGISRITFAGFWNTVEASRAARNAASLPPDSDRRVLVSEGSLQGFAVPVLAARLVTVDGATVSLFGKVWADDPARPGVFTTEIADEGGKPLLRIERVFARGASDASPYLLTLSHTITNLDGAPHAVQFVQYGPGDLPRDASSMLEVRRFHFGDLFPPERDPSQSTVLANGQMFERSAVLGEISAGQFTLWPNRDAAEGRFSPVWFGATDRYFALAVHAQGTGSKRLESVLEVKSLSSSEPAPNDAIFTELWSPSTTIAAGASASHAMGVYAGPLDPRILEGVEPYSSLGMGDLIVYVMAGCCSWCTFAWLSDALLWFLTLLHDHVLFDWGVAIIALVVIVRLLLHPLQKKSQISMQRFSRAMTAMKPELDALQKKFKDDPRRMQAEQMRLFREKGVSPAGCVGGMFPMFAQMPIWMALYAVLYFAFPLRHQAPFYGLFQSFGDWSFLADLSAPDNFIRFSQPVNLWLFSLASINLLPLLMGVVFWIQQQYMTPPQPNMSEEQLAQQRTMKWMMTLMFPVMMYVVPSGLTLYIFTSTCIGILESRIIKKQVDAMDFSKPAETPRKKKDLLGRLYERALERAQQDQGQRKKFKDR